MPNDTPTQREKKLTLLALLAKEYPSLIKELLRTYALNELNVLVMSAVEGPAGATQPARMAAASRYLAKLVGMDDADLAVPVVLSPGESDTWEELSSQIG